MAVTPPAGSIESPFSVTTVPAVFSAPAFSTTGLGPKSTVVRAFRPTSIEAFKSVAPPESLAWTVVDVKLTPPGAPAMVTVPLCTVRPPKSAVVSLAANSLESAVTVKFLSVIEIAARAEVGSPLLNRSVTSASPRARS